ncbi:MAG: hypothetical protein DHS20C01_00330 [marine bacterium B5-7]|nr:MAG: hypothetical protein DHS20C01_00330 [marine bacterium B5-7]
MQIDEPDLLQPARRDYPVFLKWRRAVYFALVTCTAIYGAWTMGEIVVANGVTPTSIGIFVLFAVTFSQVAAFFWTGVIGFAIHIFSRNPVRFTSPLKYPMDSLAATIRTAVVMPVYNEQPERVITGLEASIHSLASLEGWQQFEFFLLSDTTDDAIAADELQMVHDLRLRLTDELTGDGPVVHYRRREQNIDRKVGNIADFCANWGDQFEAMIVLDADSVMSGETMQQLAALMQLNPAVGIIQTVPLPVNQSTLFARMIQFGGRLCSEMLCAGKSFWQLGEGNYFGHNAIIRIKPFIEHCQLPVLSGRGPLSGAILSHDFVEAALMRRAGWQVWNLPDGSGSFEELPSNILDYARRDRRWCQGNLQHLRLLFTPGFHPVSRLHLLMGALSFISSPLWFCLLVLGLAQIVSQALVHMEYVVSDNYLLPAWPVFKTAEALSLLLMTMAMLLMPKVLAVMLALSDRSRRTAFGGSLVLSSGAFLEIVFAALVAPVLMVFHSVFIFLIVGGWAVTWNAQPRGNRGLNVTEAVQYQALQLFLGVTLLILISRFTPEHAVWLSPVVAGLVLCVPMAVISSKAMAGLWLLRWKLLATPEELQAPPELQLVQARDELLSGARVLPLLKQTTS